MSEWIRDRERGLRVRMDADHADLGITVVAIDVAVVWALTADERDMDKAQQM